MTVSIVTVPQYAVRKAAIAVTGGPFNCFTIAGGRVLVRALYGTVVTAIGAAATRGTLGIVPTVGSPAALASDSPQIENSPVGTLLSITGDPADVMSMSEGAVMSQSRPVICQPGTILFQVTSGGTTGAIDWYVTWEALDAGATLVAA